jgi:hypothetical protein
VPAGLTFREGTVAGICVGVPAYNLIFGINIEPEYTEKEDMLNLSRLHS